MIELSPSVPAGAHRRLIEHYGPSVRAWLDDVEATISASAARFGIAVDGFHDAGWTSVVAVGRQPGGQGVVLKASVDPERYRQERAALAHWDGSGACHLLDSDDAGKVLMTALVGCAAGGQSRPADDTRRVADALPRLHRANVHHTGTAPVLRDYYRHTVLPRIEQRAARFSSVIDQWVIHRALMVGAQLCITPHRPAMLHADLYADNVLFDIDGRPVFIDPHPKVGSPAFDWAFWCVYYRQDGEFSNRVQLAREHVPELTDEVLSWALTLAVDGALYYADAKDPAVNDMRAVLGSVELRNILTGPRQWST